MWAFYFLANLDRPLGLGRVAADHGLFPSTSHCRCITCNRFARSMTFFMLALTFMTTFPSQHVWNTSRSRSGTIFVRLHKGQCLSRTCEGLIRPVGSSGLSRLCLFRKCPGWTNSGLLLCTKPDGRRFHGLKVWIRAFLSMGNTRNIINLFFLSFFLFCGCLFSPNFLPPFYSILDIYFFLTRWPEGTRGTHMKKCKTVFVRRRNRALCSILERSTMCTPQAPGVA